VADVGARLNDGAGVTAVVDAKSALQDSNGPAASAGFT